MSDQSPKESPATSPSPISTQVDKNVESIKTRIVATSKLIKYVQNAKADLEKGNTAIAELEKKLKASQKLANEREKRCSELMLQLQKEKTGGSESATQSQTPLENNKILDDLKQKVTLAEEAKHKAEEALKGQKMYINQLEARSKELEEASKKASENTKISDKTRNEMNKKNEELRKAGRELALQQKKIAELEDKVATMTDIIDKFEDDEMESRVNSDMAKQEIQEAKDELAKMETRLEHFINENESLKDEKKALSTQIERLRSSLNNQENKSQKDDNTTESIPQEQSQFNHEGLKKALYFSEAQYDVLESENKLLRAKLARWMARQREREDVDMNDNVLRRQQLLYYAAEENDNQSSSDFIFDTTSLSGNTQPVVYRGPTETGATRKAPTTKLIPPTITFAPYPDRRSATSHNETPQETPLKKPSVKRSNTGLYMPQSNVTPAKTKASGSSSSAASKKSKLEKFIKNPSKYATKSTFIPLTQLESKESNPLPEPQKETSLSKEASKESSPAKVVSSRETSPDQHISQPEPSRAEASTSAALIVTEEAIIPENITIIHDHTTVATKAPPNVPAPSSSLGKRFLDDSSSDEESEGMGRSPKAAKSDLPLDSFIEKLINEKKLPMKEDLERYTTHAGIGELIAEIVGLYRRFKSVANPMAKSFKPVVMKEHGIKNVLVVQLPEHLDKREKHVSWFLTLLVTQFNEGNLYDVLKNRLRTTIMTCLETKHKDSAIYRFTRLLTSLCKEANDAKFIYRFCFDICRYGEMEQQILICILNAAYIWGDGFALSEVSDMNEKGSQMVLKTVQTVTCHIAKREGASAATKNLYTSIAKITKWPEDDEGLYQMAEEISKVFNTDILEQVHNSNQAIFVDLRCCIIRCLEMIFFYIKNWKITYDSYIRETLWPMLTDDILDDIALELLGILGIFGLAKSNEEENEKGISDFISRFKQLINLGDAIPAEAKHLQKTAEKGFARLTGDTDIPLPEWV